jgi:hypothetical protein
MTVSGAMGCGNYRWQFLPRKARVCREEITTGDLANLAVAALVFGQAIGQDSFVFGVVWQDSRLVAIHGGDVLPGRRDPMTTALFMLGLIALTAFTIALLDWFGRRKDRENERRRSA